MTRDNQRIRVYRAMWALPGGKDQTIPNDQLQAWADKALAKRAVQSRWGRVHVDVQLKRGGRALSHGGRITLPRFARNPWMILHELAHELTPSRYAPHGPEYVGVYLFLVKTVLGAEQQTLARAALKAQKARSNNRAIPAAGRRPVVTAKQKAAAQRARATRPVRRSEAVEAAAIIRRAVTNGAFGPAGCKPRVHALATARALEK